MGAYLRACGPSGLNDAWAFIGANTSVLAPPLVITESEIETLLAKAKRCIGLTAKTLGVKR